MKFLSSIYWSAGNIRKSNQDTVVLQQVVMGGNRVLLALTADGMGGFPEGEIASGYAAEAITEWFYETGLDMIRRHKRQRWIIRSILRVFHKVGEDMERYGARKSIRMGTTITMLLIWRKRCLVFHLGDSRLYLCRKKGRQLTEDHSDPRGALKKCLGTFGWQKPDIYKGKIRCGSGYLLCTDGFRNCVSTEQLEEAFRPGGIRDEREIERRLREVAAYSMKKGEQDNISAIYIKIV